MQNAKDVETDKGKATGGEGGVRSRGANGDGSDGDGRRLFMDPASPACTPTKQGAVAAPLSELSCCMLRYMFISVPLGT